MWLARVRPAPRPPGAPSLAGVRSPRPLRSPPLLTISWPRRHPRALGGDTEVQRGTAPRAQSLPGGPVLCPLSSSKCLDWVPVPSLPLACPTVVHNLSEQNGRGDHPQQPHRIIVETKEEGAGVMTGAYPVPSAPLCPTLPLLPTALCRSLREASELLHGPCAPGGQLCLLREGHCRGRCGPGRARRFPVRLWVKWDCEWKSTF